MEIVLIKSYTDKPWRSPETYQMIEDSLGEKWNVHSIHAENSESLFKDLTALRQEYGEDIFVFNIAEFLDEENKDGFIPALLDEWHMPHLGSSAESVATGLDKEKTKILLDEYQIPTPRYFVAHKGDPDITQQAESIGFPLFVKPNGEGGHIGISEDSIVYDQDGLERAVRRIFDQNEQPALVEKYITRREMREFSVGILDGETRLFTPVEIDFESMEIDTPILSYEAANKDLERIMPVRDEKIRAEISELAERTFLATDARDYSRVDIRMNHTGCYVLEINIMPGLGPHSFLPEAAKELHALEYNQFIQKLAEESMKSWQAGKHGSLAV